MRQPVSAALAAIVFAAAGAACHSESQLEPAQSAQSVTGLDQSIAAADHDIGVVAQPDAWPGQERISDEVTPLRVVIENQSDREIALRYENFQLIAGDGSHYRVMPPLRMQGEAPIQNPRVLAKNFEVAPYMGTAYPDYARFDGPFYDAADYYGTYYDWGTELPTQEMRARAIPEGVLKPGGRIDGFLYFQKMKEPEDSRVTFEAKFPLAGEASQGPQAQPFATVSVPFKVSD